jgi:diaminopimelate decarboxylase
MPRPFPLTAEQLRELADQFPTPFYLYDEAGIRETCRELNRAFKWTEGFRNYYAVKALPNPHVLKIVREEGMGADCSSKAELFLSQLTGLSGEQVMFTSNNTPITEYMVAKELGAILNLDDISHIDFIHEQIGLPELVSFRFNPGAAREGNVIIGRPEEAKYGFTESQLFDGYRRLDQLGVRRFGLHTMVASNELDSSFFVETARMLFDLVIRIHQQLNVRIEFVNLGGGVGIPYRPNERPVDLEWLGGQIHDLYQAMIVSAGLDPLRIVMENGRMVTGPHGFLVTRCLHHKKIYRQHVGVDACMANLMRPGMYNAYHHITVPGRENEPQDCVVDVVGSLCENNDKFAVQRSLPEIQRDDLLVIHDAGAHGHAMGFQYNGKTRSAELLLLPDGGIKQIRRAETQGDLFATLDFSEFN